MLRRLNHDPMTARPPDAQKDNRRAELSFLTPEPYGPTTVSRHALSVPDTALRSPVTISLLRGGRELRGLVDHHRSNPW